MKTNQTEIIARKIAKMVACNSNTVFYVRNYDDRSKDPRKVREQYIHWLSDVINEMLQENEASNLPSQ